LSLLDKCTENGITLTDLAEMAEVSTEYLSRLNTGKNKNPTLKIMNKICEVFDVSLDELNEIFKN
jgi:DNA-binding Xre family transcriptional regulator